MPETATIYIPDISGFTEFLTKTEVEHSSRIINGLLEAIIQSMSGEFVVSEVEGDAVLLYKKGSPPTMKEMIEQSTKTFKAFQGVLKENAGSSLCQCNACTGARNLTLKFVLHYGTIAEISVSNFLKASGVDMVIAHRLLKNSVPLNEYILASANYVKHADHSDVDAALSWVDAKDEYPSIGVVEYRFASLSPLKGELAPLREHQGAPLSFDANDTVETYIDINSHFIDVHECLIDLSVRPHFVEGIRHTHGPEVPMVNCCYFCVFDEGKAEIIPRYITKQGEEIIYQEQVNFPELDFFALYEYNVKATGTNSCRVTWRVSPQPNHPFSENAKKLLIHNLQTNPQRLKEYCESNFPGLKAVGKE